MFTGGGKKYLAGKDGKIRMGSFKWKKKYYITNKNGAIITKKGLYNYGNNTYYVNKGGAIATSTFVTYKDKHYYANSDGTIAKKKFKYRGITIVPNSKTGEISLEDYWKVFPEEAPQEATDAAA